jgi:hypothetical protein
MIRASAPDFWRLWFVGLVVFTVRWLETVAVGVVVYQRTGSAFLVAMMTMLRLLPMGLFGAFLGALAERFDRRLTLIGVVVLMGTTSAILAALAWTGALQVWHLALASFVNGCGWATDNPVRRMMMGEAVGREHMGTAMSLDVGANNASRMVGPSVGGFLLAGVGIEGAFLLSVLMYVGAIAAAMTVRSRIPRAVGSGAVLARIAEGLAIVRGDKRLIGTLIVTIIYNDTREPRRHRRVLRSIAACVMVDAALVRTGLRRRGRCLHDHADRVRGRYRAGDRGRGTAADGHWGRRVFDHAGDTGVSRRAGGNALPDIGRAVGLYRNRTDRICLAWLAGGSDRRAQRDGGDRCDGAARAGRDVAVLADDLNGD